MKNFWLLAGFFILTTHGFSQFTGGYGDGFHFITTGTQPLNNQLFYCTGGYDDGFHFLTSGTIPMNNQQLYCTGGYNDGFHFLTSGTIPMNNQQLYCTGGYNDGFHFLTSGTSPLNNQQFYCTGGYNDGFHFLTLGTQPLNNQQLYCTGGYNDGFHFLTLGPQPLNNQQLYCTGGYNDGFHFLTSGTQPLNNQLFYCTGGYNDGFFMLNLAQQPINGQSIYCLGGYNDGFHFLSLPVVQLGRGIWLGVTNYSWTEPSNWKGNAIPDLSTDVFIPSGCLFYPFISTGDLSIANIAGTYKCNSLILDYGAALINNRHLSVHGPMTISGLYRADNDLDNTVLVNPGGHLSITSTGHMKVGNQGIGYTGSSDVKINGGALEINGGTLEVDDQFNHLSGTFTMSGGTLFAHKNGTGTAYTSSSPGAFYVASTASGNVSGGTVKVAGRATNNDSVAVKINSPSFAFSGNSFLEFTQGVNERSDDAELRVVSGVALNNIRINAPLRKVKIGSDAVFNGKMIIEPGSTLEILPGKTVTVADSLILNRN
jgi:hypothetical protein